MMTPALCAAQWVEGLLFAVRMKKKKKKFRCDLAS